jgi:drug/metabolite transporter (DMT)-like permease
MTQAQATYAPSRPLTASPTASPIPLPVMVGMFCILWSSAYSVAKLAIADCPPLILLAVRFLAAGVLMLALARVQGARWTLSRRDVALFAALGVANQALFLGLGYIGLRDISSGLSALIVSANPVVTAVLAVLLLGERMTWGKSLGLLLGIGGVAFIVGSRISAGSDHLQGILLTIAALLSLAGGTILFKRFAPKDGLWIGNGVQSLAAGVASLPFALTFESVGDVVPTWRLLAAFAYLVLLVSVFAYLLWFQILTVSGATAASSYYFLMPPLGMLFGWLLLGERMATSDLLGIVPVVLGIYLVTRPAAARG